MGTMFSFLAKAAASSAIFGYAANQLISPLMLSRTVHISATAVASFAGLASYMKLWIQEHYFDWSYNDSRDLAGRTAVVTGGTINGLGFATAELLYKQGAKVIITVRTKEKGDAALAQLKDQASSPLDDNRASYVLCDFLSEQSVRDCAEHIKSKNSDGIDFLVLNAGVSGQSKASSNQKDSASTEEKAKDAFTAKVWMTNHVGPWIFAKELMQSLVQTAKRNPSEHPRVVWVASGAHKRADINWENPFHPNSTLSGVVTSSYGQSKLANIMHAREYQKQVRDVLRKQETDESEANQNLDVKCFPVTPGLVWTNIIPKIPLLYPLYWFIMRSPTKGAQVIKMACLDNDLKGGEYLSNCYVKKSEGINGCSNDEEQWKRLWELTAKQVEEKEYEKFIETSNVNKKNI